MAGSRGNSRRRPSPLPPSDTPHDVVADFIDRPRPPEPHQECEHEQPANKDEQNKPEQPVNKDEQNSGDSVSRQTRLGGAVLLATGRPQSRLTKCCIGLPWAQTGSHFTPRVSRSGELSETRRPLPCAHTLSAPLLTGGILN